MLRAASGQAGTAITPPLPPDTRNRPRLNAIASSNGSFANNLPPTGNVRVNALVAIVRVSSAAPGREIVTIRVARSQRSVMAEP